VICWRRVGGGVSTDPLLSSMYGLMMSVNIGMKQRWDRSLKTLLVMGTGCAGPPLWLITLMAPMRWSVQSLTTLSGMG